MALVFFPFCKGGSGVLANCSLCGTEAFLFFWWPKIVEVFPLKPAPFCELFAGLGNPNKFVTSLLSDCRSILCALSSFPSFLLPQIFWWICPVFFTIRGYNGSRDILSSGERRGWELARRDAILVSSAVSCSPFAFTSLMQSLFFGLGAYRLITTTQHTGHFGLLH